MIMRNIRLKRSKSAKSRCMLKRAYLDEETKMINKCFNLHLLKSVRECESETAKDV